MTKIQDFAKEINEKLIIEKVPYTNIYKAKFDATIRNEGHLAAQGETEDGALQKYCNDIRGKMLIFRSGLQIKMPEDLTC